MRTGDKCFPVERFELVEAAAVDDARDHLSHVVRALQVVAHNAVEVVGRIQRRLHLCRAHQTRLLRDRHTPLRSMCSEREHSREGAKAEAPAAASLGSSCPLCGGKSVARARRSVRYGR